MIVVHEENAPAVNVPAPFKRTLKVLLSPVIHSESVPIAAGLTILPSGGKSDIRKHSEGEMFYVISGNGCIKAGGKKEEIIPGTMVWVPGETEHQLLNTSDKTLKILWILSPPGREAEILKKADNIRHMSK